MDFISLPLYKVNTDGSCSCGYSHDPKKPGQKDSKPQIGKHPVYNGWQTDLKGHYVDLSQNNIGVRTGSINNLIVIDIDPRSGGTESFQQLKKDLNIEEFDFTCTVNTGGGGKHYYYMLRPGELYSSRSHAFGKDRYPGIDIKCEGGYVIGVGSNHRSGQIYKWEEGASPRELCFEYFPDILKPLLEKKHLVAERSKDNLSQTFEVTPSDLQQLKSALFKLSSESYDSWVKYGLALNSIKGRDVELFQIFDEWSARSPKYDQVQTINKWRQCSNPHSISYKTIFHDANKLNKPPQLASVTPLPTKPPTEKKEYFTELPPEGFVRDLILEIESEWVQFPRHISLFLGHVIMAPLFQGLVKTPTNGSISTYALITGCQGSHKTNAIMKFLDPFLHQVDPRMVSSHTASDTALKQMFGGDDPVPNYSATMTIEEVLGVFKKWHKLSAMGDVTSNTVNTLWSMNDQGYLPQRKAAQRTDNKGNKQTNVYDSEKVVGPSLSIIGGGTSNEWQQLAQDSDFLSKGIGTRIELVEWGKLIFKRGMPYSSDISRYKRFTSHLSNLRENLQPVYGHSNRKMITWSKDTEELFWDKVELCHDHQNKIMEEPDSGRLNMLRLPELALRMATRMTAADMEITSKGVTSNIEISPYMLGWCWQYVLNRHQMYEEFSDVDTSHESQFRNKILSTFLKYPTREWTRSQISGGPGRRLNLSTDQRRKVVDEMAESSEIFEDNKRYRLTPLGIALAKAES